MFQWLSPAPVNCKTRGGERGQIKAAFSGRAQLELVRFEVLCGLAKFLIFCCFETAAVHSGKGHWTAQAIPEMQEVAGLVRRMSQDIRAKRGQAGPGHTSNSQVALEKKKKATSRKASETTLWLWRAEPLQAGWLNTANWKD